MRVLQLLERAEQVEGKERESESKIDSIAVLQLLRAD